MEPHRESCRAGAAHDPDRTLVHSGKTLTNTSVELVKPQRSAWEHRVPQAKHRAEGCPSWAQNAYPGRCRVPTLGNCCWLWAILPLLYSRALSCQANRRQLLGIPRPSSLHGEGRAIHKPPVSVGGRGPVRTGHCTVCVVSIVVSLGGQKCAPSSRSSIPERAAGQSYV